MKAATPSKTEGTLSAKKVVKKVVSKPGASNVVTRPAGVSPEKYPSLKKEAVSKPSAAQAKLKSEEPNVELKLDSLPVSNTQEAVANEPTNTTEDAAAVGLKKPRGLTKSGEKPKTKTVIVKKKVIVTKKTAALAALAASSQPGNASISANVSEKLENEATKQQVTDTRRDFPEKPSLKDTKPTSPAPEMPYKVVRKGAAKGKGSLTDVNKDNKDDIDTVVEQNTEASVQKRVEVSVKTNNSQVGNSSVRGALPPREELEELEEDEADQCETMDIVAEELQLYDSHEFEEEPEFEEEAEEEQGAEIGEGYKADMAQKRHVSERQKRKKLEVFVGGLDKDATEEEIRVAFRPVGDVMEVRLMMNPLTGKNKGYAFVQFATAEQAGRAATDFATMQIRGKECGVLPNQDNDTLFIGNISRDWKSSEVLQKLEEYGVNGIEQLTLIADPQNEALNRGYAFLELATHYDAVNAFQRLHRPGVMFGYDRPAKVSWAQPLNDNDPAMMSQVKSVFVDGIPPNWTDDKVKQSFGMYGDIERIVFARNMPFAKRKDFAFVNFTTSESALACVEASRDTELSDGDKKFKVKVSLTRPIQKGRSDKWSNPKHRGPPGQGRGHAGRGEGWVPTRFGSRGAGRGSGWSGGNHGVTGRGGKRLYDEDEVRMMLKAAREEGDWSSTARGRGGRYARPSRGMARGGYDREDGSRHFAGRRAENYREQSEPDYTHGGYHIPASDLATPRGIASRPDPMRDDYESQHLGPYSRSRVPQHTDRYRNPHHEGARHQKYEHGPAYGGDEGGFSGLQDYKDVGVGMKRPASTWVMDEDYGYYESGHRGNPRARADYLDSNQVPESITHYASYVRSPPGPAAQVLGTRQPRSAREAPISSFYDSGSGAGKAGVSSTYDDHSYTTMLPETSSYLSEVPERREVSTYPTSFYGGHSSSAGYDFQASGYY